MEAAKNDFRTIVSTEFTTWCKSKEIEPNNDALLSYLLERNIITELTIKRFVVVKKYPFVLSENSEIKTAAVWQLEEMYNISESTIRVILKRFQSYFRK
jgi:hypothetical protein